MMHREILRRAPGLVDGLPPSLHPVLRRVYAARGVNASDELELSLARLLPVSSLDGVERAVAVLLEHLARRSRIVVVGDFDADGATSSALVVRQLVKLGFPDVRFRVPDRMRHGYGLTPVLVEELVPDAPQLIITVDNGVAALPGIECARRHGMEVLVTDHHLPGAVLPECAAMVNPNLHGAQFGSRALAGVGVAFYLMAALTRELEQQRGERQPSPAELLDLVALGTVADLVPLDRNNRILVSEGLRRIRMGRCAVGIRALAEVAGRKQSDLQAQDLGFYLAPRVNAAGRLDDMTVGIRCLVTDDAGEARGLAERLQQLNVERRELEARMRDEAVEAVKRLRISEGSLPAGVALFDDGWHAGVVGLVASRLKDRLHRPVIALAPAEDGWLRGSARSVAGVHVRDVLERIDTLHPGLIERYGGHAMAAGLTLARGGLERFSAAFADEVARWLSPDKMRGVIESDGALAPSELGLDTAEALRQGGPWGQAFAEPMFDGEFGVVEARPVGGKHLRVFLRAEQASRPIEGIAFNVLAEPGAPDVRAGQRLRVAYRFDVSEWGGQRKPEMKIEYLEPVCGTNGSR